MFCSPDFGDFSSDIFTHTHAHVHAHEQNFFNKYIQFQMDVPAWVSSAFVCVCVPKWNLNHFCLSCRFEDV